MLQSCGIYPHLTVRETVAHWATLYPRAARRRRGRSRSSGSRRRPTRRARTLSGGQQRRLDFALALVGDPELIFLDEPTTGFDPAARRAAWDVVRALRELGKTVLLTTHYLDEAQALADRVAIVKDGRILAEGAAGDARRRRRPRYRVAWRDAERRADERETDDPTALLHELTGEALARGERLRGAQRDAADASRTSTSSSPPRPMPSADRRSADRRLARAWRLAWRQYRLERRMFWRNPSAAFFNFLLPLLLLALFGAVFSGGQDGARRDRARASPA